MKVIVAGGRDVTLMAAVEDAIAESALEISELVCGCARGVDTLAEEWAKGRGIPVRRFFARWTLHGRRAGPIRNREMAAYADALILIPTGGPGSMNMLQEAKRAGLERIHIHCPSVW